MYETLKHASSLDKSTREVDTFIVDAPPPAAAMAARLETLHAACERALGPDFERAYAHCKARYAQADVDMAAVQRELVDMVESVPAAHKRNAVGQLKMLVFSETML